MIFFLRDFIHKKLKHKNISKLKTRKIKSLTEEEIPSGTKLNFKHILLITFLSIFAIAIYLINVTIIILSPPHNLWKSEEKSIENMIIS